MKTGGENVRGEPKEGDAHRRMLEEYPWKVMETLQKAVRRVPTEGDSSSTRSIARQMG